MTMTKFHYISCDNDGIKRYCGSDPRLHSQVGEKAGRARKTTGKDGYLLHGPYEPLASGSYRILIEGEINALHGDEVLDIVSNQGANVIKKISIKKQHHGIWRSLFRLDLEKSVSDFEVRLRVNKNSDISVSQIEIKYLRDHNYDYDFAIVNKSYEKDLLWSVALYKSWTKHSRRKSTILYNHPSQGFSGFYRNF